MNKKVKPVSKDTTAAQDYLLSLDEIEEIRFANHSIHEYKGQDIVEHAEDISEFINGHLKTKFLICLAEFIKDPMIIDSFNVEENRRMFERHLKENNYEAHEFLKRNRLRRNRLARAIGILWEKDLFKISPKLKSKVNWINDQLKGKTKNGLDYHQLPTKKKIWIADQLTYIVRQAYDEIIENL